MACRLSGSGQFTERMVHSLRFSGFRSDGNLFIHGTDGSGDDIFRIVRNGRGNYDLFTGSGSSLKRVWETGNNDMVGSIQMFARTSPPAGYLKANGAAVSRSRYSDLYSVIGTRFGNGDGSSTFNLPDLRGTFPRAWDDGRGYDPGRGMGDVQGHQLVSHRHSGRTSDDSHQHSATTTEDGHNHTGKTSWVDNHDHATDWPLATEGNSGDFAVAGDGGRQKGYGFTRRTQGSGAHDHTFTTSWHAHRHTLDTSWHTHAHDFNTNYTGGNETRPVNFSLLACIKY